MHLYEWEPYVYCVFKAKIDALAVAIKVAT